MRVISCHLENFASYKELDFNFEGQGLALIQGATGAGKSTLCDAIPWVLFGSTAKNGAVDEVISWDSSGRTFGSVIIDLGPKVMWVTRTRKPNDLYFILPAEGEHQQRGKDLNDTQKLINNLLGFDSALYLSGAYFHEFSQTAQFFITTAKNRRIICEQLVDLSLAKTLQAKLTETAKELKTKSHEFETQIQYLNRNLEHLNAPNDYKQKSDSFEKDKNLRIAKLNTEIHQVQGKIRPQDYFAGAMKDLVQAKKYLGEAICAECGAKKDSDKHTQLSAHEAELRQEEKENRWHKEKLQMLKASLAYEQVSKNPFSELIARVEQEKVDAKANLDSALEIRSKIAPELNDIEILLEVVNDFRGATIQNTIKQLEHRTNKLLTDHFDAEIKVSFEVADADKLDVTIFKDGNACSYTQLSKGQRQLLKLSFAVSVMRVVANRHGIQFNCAFLDEALDGMDDNFKVKTYGLLQHLALEFESVFVVEHNEALKQMFENKYTVQLVNGSSVIEKS